MTQPDNALTRCGKEIFRILFHGCRKLIFDMSYHQILYHIVFRTYQSVPAITQEHETLFYRYVWGIIKNSGWILHRIGGMPDHVHLLVQLPPSVTVADFMHKVKLASTTFMNGHRNEFPLFSGWGRSYCALSCSYSAKTDVIDYIRTQKEHHRVHSFEEELLALLQANGVEPNPKYFPNTM